MKGKFVLTLASFTLSIAIVARFASKYLQWKQEVLQRLQTNSSIMDTTSGPIEYSVKGTGPAILFAHGSPGGYDQSLATADMFKSDQFTYIAVSDLPSADLETFERAFSAGSLAPEVK